MNSMRTPKRNPMCTHLHKRDNTCYFCRRIPADVHNAITGHTSGNVADNYNGLPYPLVKAMKRHKVPRLTLSDLPATNERWYGLPELY